MNNKKFVLNIVILIFCIVWYLGFGVWNLSPVLASGAGANANSDTFGIFGNANEDGTIDMCDVNLTERIILGLEEPTALADAKFDGRIDMCDVTQTELIILGTEKTLTFVDSRGEDVTVNMPVKRIIALSDPHADAIRVLEAENHVVGVSSGLAEEKMLLPVMSKRPVVGSSSNPDPEAILALNPDIAITYATWNVGLEEKVEPYVTIVRIDLSLPETIVEDMKKFGYILDKRREAEEFIDWYKGCMDEIRNRTEGLSEDDKPRVYLELYPDIWMDKTMSKGSSGDWQCIIAGGINIAGDLPESSHKVDPEWIIEQDPEIIVQIVTSKLPSGYDMDDITGIKGIREDAMTCKEWQNITAVKNENIYVVASDIRCGIQMVISTTYWAKWFHPELFEDLDPQAIHREYLDKFHRIDFDVYEHGVFVYPEAR